MQTKHAFDVTATSQTLAAILRKELGLPWSKAKALCEHGRVKVDDKVVVDPAFRLTTNCRVEINPHAPRPRKGTLSTERLVYVDHDVVVVNKPPNLLSVPYEESDKDTLIDQTHAWLRQHEHNHGPQRQSLGAVQRLDKDTTGLLVFARNLQAKRHLQTQFRNHSIERVYQALVYGTPHDQTFETWLLQDRGDGLRGTWGLFRKRTGAPPALAQRALTHVRVIQSSKEISLVECKLETGRQHQIRIHLSEAGHPLVGESVYIRDYKGARMQVPRPMLHACVLGITHPRTLKPLRWQVPLPQDFLELYKSHFPHPKD